MTEEELKKQLSELQDEKDSILNKNKELLTELKKLKNASKEYDVDSLLKTIDDLESKVSIYEKDNKILKADFEKTSKLLTEKDGKLKQTLISDGLTKALIEAGIDDKHLAVVKSFHERNVVLDENYNAVIDGKSLGDFAKEWLGSDNGKIYTKFNPTSGGGANGSHNGNQSKPFKEMSEAERVALYRSNPAQFAELSKQQ